MVFINRFKNFKNQILNKLIIKRKLEWAFLVNHSVYGMYNDSIMCHLTGTLDSSETIINVGTLNLYENSLIEKWESNGMINVEKKADCDCVICSHWLTNGENQRVANSLKGKLYNTIVDRGLRFIYEQSS